MAFLHQGLGLAAEAVVVPGVIEPVVVLVVAHQEQTVLIQLPVEGAAIGQGPVVAAGYGLEVQRLCRFLLALFRLPSQALRRQLLALSVTGRFAPCASSPARGGAKNTPVGVG